MYNTNHIANVLKYTKYYKKSFFFLIETGKRVLKVEGNNFEGFFQELDAFG